MMNNASSSLLVWGGSQRAGLLARETRGDYTFSYSQQADVQSQLSLTMPLRLKSWQSRNLHPIFQMNLPEGSLLDAIRRAIAKIIGNDDLAVLQVTGGSQLGRNRFSLPGEDFPAADDNTEQLEELLTYPDTRELFHELLSRYAMRSGISGIQPKVLLAAHERGTLTARQYIVKSWGSDFPHLAANEFFCMTAAKKAGLPVADFFLAENGGLFIMRRFDIGSEDSPLGFEDLCCLQAKSSDEKYDGSYEQVAKALQNYISAEHLAAAREQFFLQLVLSVILRNGDAHLKNFGVLYPDPQGPVTLSPAYDIVTTTAYIKNDVPALTIEGSKKWWPRKTLVRFGITRLALPESIADSLIECAIDAVADTRLLLNDYQRLHPEFQPIAADMLLAWEDGMSALMP